MYFIVFVNGREGKNFVNKVKLIYEKAANFNETTNF